MAGPLRIFRGASIAAVASLFVACAPSAPAENARSQFRPGVARVDVLEGRECGGRASVRSVPEHCDLTTRSHLDWVLSADVQLVADVNADGTPRAVRVVKAPQGYELEESVVECAMRGEYTAAADQSGNGVAGETCPITLRLRRYASDVGRSDPPPIPCPVVQPYSTGTTLPSAGADCTTR